MQIVTFELPYGRCDTIRIPPFVSPAVAFFGLNRDLKIDQAIASLKKAYPTLANGSQAAIAKEANLKKHFDRYYQQHVSTKGADRASVVNSETSAAAPSSSAAAFVLPKSEAAYNRQVRAEKVAVAASVHEQYQASLSAWCSLRAYVQFQMHSCIYMFFTPLLPLITLTDNALTN
jgi:hypothetical protein